MTTIPMTNNTAAEEIDNGFTSDVNGYTEVMDDEVIRGSVQAEQDDR